MCPLCGSHNITRTRAGEPDSTYQCQDCNESFQAPNGEKKRRSGR